MIHTKKTITLLIPCHNEEKNLGALIKELDRVVCPLTNYCFSYLFVDDGSTDSTYELLEEYAGKRTDIMCIGLSRNFGKEIALTAGIQSVKCDALVILDADLQHPPSLIPEMITSWENGNQVIATKRASIANRGVVKKVGSLLFYRMLNAISETKMESQTTDFRLLDRIVVEALKQFTERNRMVRGLIDWMGFKRVYLSFDAPDRFEGEASYTFVKLVRLAINNFTGFSLFPLRIAGYLGTFIFLIFSLLLLIMISDRFLYNTFHFSNISYVIVANSILTGVLLMSLGLIAMYIGNIHTEVVNRPLFVIGRQKNLHSK